MSRTVRLKQPRQFGKYQLVAHLATGRLGEVYKAKSHGVEGFERVLVIKAIDQDLAALPGFVEIIAEEAQRAVLLSHANIVQVLNLGEETITRQPFLALEFVQGMDLQRALQVSGALGRAWPMELAVFIVAELSNGLDYAHRRKDFDFNKLHIVHGDVAPPNVLLSTEGEAKLSDFGLARALNRTAPASEADARRRALYQAPEVLCGGELSQRADVFSLGALFYELLCGQSIYHLAGQDTARLMELARRGATAPLPDREALPRPLVKLLESMLVADPNGRIGSAGQVYEELVGYIYGNNLQRADARALGLYVQSLRDQEADLYPDQLSQQDADVEEISLSELQVPENATNAIYGELSPESLVEEVPSPDVTSDALPRHKLQQVFMNAADASSAGSSSSAASAAALPPKLNELLLATRAGRGKAVLLHGRMGRGRDYVPDRLAEMLGQQANTMACAVQCLRDDEFRPFGIMGDLLAASLLPQLDERERDLPHAIEALRRREVSPRAVEALAELWDIAPSRTMLGQETTRRLMSEACLAVIGDLCRRHTLVFLIDRVEHMDALSFDVLRDLLAQIAHTPCMVLMTTRSLETMQRKLDTGDSAHLDSVKFVGGQEPPRHDSIEELSADGEQVLMLLCVAQIALNQADLTALTGWPQERLFNAIKEIMEQGLIRGPQPGLFLSTYDEVLAWSKLPPRRMLRRQKASMLLEAAQAIEPAPGPLAMLRFAALGHRRRTFMARAEERATWLVQRGWLRTAMALYKHLSELAHESEIGASQARLKFMVARAHLALDLALPEACSASIGPIQALAETLHDEPRLIDSQLLLGHVAMMQDDITEARRLFSAALKAADAIQEPDLLASAMTATAGWFERYGDLVSGQRMIEGALNLHARWGTQRMNLPARATLMNLAVQVWCLRGMPARAARLVEDLERLAERARLAELNCRVAWAKGYVLSARREDEAAIMTLKRAASIATYHHLTALELDVLRHLVHLLLRCGQLSQTRPLLERLQEMAEAHQDRYTLLRASEMSALADVLGHTQAEQGLSTLHAHLERALQRDVPKDIYRCHALLKRAYQTLGDSQSASEHRQLAAEIARSMRYHSASSSVVAKSVNR